jgi:2-C-methyl-D-erythritol 4-phosphate cytidylyltransferase
VNTVPQTVKNVLIHDAARALVGTDVIDRVLAALENELAVLAAIPAADTIVAIDHNQQLTAIPDRSGMWQAQTPQGFRLEIIRQAHELARAEGFSGASDDCSLVLRYKLAQVATVLGDPANIKITYPQDLPIAEAILKISDR